MHAVQIESNSLIMNGMRSRAKDLATTQNQLRPHAVVQEPIRKPPRLPYLDGLRAIAALYVVIHHLALHTHSITLYQSIPGLGLFAYGRLAVVLFIVLSGYCLM